MFLDEKKKRTNWNSKIGKFDQMVGRQSKIDKFAPNNFVSHTLVYGVSRLGTSVKSAGVWRQQKSIELNVLAAILRIQWIIVNWIIVSVYKCENFEFPK